MSTIPVTNDIYHWPDGYWCFKSDFHKQPRLSYSYRIIFSGTEEWLRVSNTASIPPAPKA